MSSVDEVDDAHIRFGGLLTMQATGIVSSRASGGGGACQQGAHESPYPPAESADGCRNPRI